MNVLLIADGDIKYGASHSLFQMAKELSSFYEINIQQRQNDGNIFGKIIEKITNQILVIVILDKLV